MNLNVVNQLNMYDEIAANQLLLQLKKKPNSAIAFATGNTPIAMYKKLVAWYRNGDIDFSQIQAFNLDEFADLDIESSNSFFSFLKRNLYDSVNIEPSHIHPIKNTEASAIVCSNYEEKIKIHGGIDLAILGIGLNGHIGYNEPGSDFHSLTHLVQLSSQTIEANSNMFGSYEETPKLGITMGIRTIMNSRKILLMARGEEKAKIVHRALYGPITKDIPASILQLHSNMVVVLDEKAAKYLKETA